MELKSPKFLRKLSAYVSSTLTSSLVGTVRSYIFFNKPINKAFPPLDLLSMLKVLLTYLTYEAVLSAIVVLPFWLLVLFADRYLKQSRLVYYVVSAVLIGVILNLILAGVHYFTWGQLGRDIVVGRDLDDTPYSAARGLIAGFTYWFIAFRPRLTQFPTESRKISMSVRNCLYLTTFLVSVTITSSVYEHLYELHVKSNLNDQIPTTRIRLTDWQIWMNQHRRLHSEDTFPVGVDGRYVVKYKIGTIHLPDSSLCRYCQIYCVVVDKDGGQIRNILRYPDVLNHPAVLRTLLNDAKSITFEFANSPTSRGLFLGVYEAATLPSFDLSVSVDLYDRKSMVGGNDPVSSTRLLEMARGVTSLDDYGFSRLVLPDPWKSHRTTTLLVAPLSDATDADGLPFYFVCEGPSCGMNDSYSWWSGPSEWSTGFHISRSVRFSAIMGRMDQEQLLKDQFLAVRRVVSDMFRD